MVDIGNVGDGYLLNGLSLFSDLRYILKEYICQRLGIHSGDKTGDWVEVDAY